jgi:hypothetical protein
MLQNIVIANSKVVGCPVAVDNDVALAYVKENPHAQTRVLGLQAHYSAAVSAVKAITMKYSEDVGDSALETTGLAIGSTDTAVASDAFHYAIAGAAYRKAAVAAGTALAAGTITADAWGIYRFSIDAAGTITCTAGAANFTTGYATEADAIAALPALPADEADMGYLTVLTDSGNDFIGGTDALQGGASGNPSDDTNYYPANPTWTTIGFAFYWDFTNGPFIGPLPGIATVPHDCALTVTLEASGGAGTTGSVAVWLVAP